MAFFKALAAIGIGRSELVGISNESLIRIEKKLTAEQKLNNSISKNDVEKALRVIKDYPDVLQEISRYDCLYGILTGYEADYIDTLVRYPPELTERIKLVVSDYFTDELTDYINLNLSHNNWNNIRVLLHYRIFLNNAIIKTLSTRLEAKMEYALAFVQQGNTHADLEKKINYIRDKEFYFTLGDADKKYFLKVIVRLIDLIKQNPGYTLQSGFFVDTRRAMRWYDINNQALANKLGIRVNPQQKPHFNPHFSGIRILYLIIVLAVPIVNLMRSCNTNATYITPKKPWSSAQNIEEAGERDSVRQDQRLKMEDFVEARIHPVNFPIDSLKTASGNIKKYQSPFGLDIFEHDYTVIKNGLPAIGIVNRTGKECVVIAYYREQYNYNQKTYQPLDYDSTINIFPLYIPAHDSISIDLKMTLLRFYMGQRLTAFKSSPRYHYPDSTDLKFSRFTQADSMLFSKAFWINNQNSVNSRWSQSGTKNKWRKKMTLLTITQPSPDSYRLSWTGGTPLLEYSNNIYQRAGKRTDSATNKKPLLYDLKNQPRPVVKNQINSFIEY